MARTEPYDRPPHRRGAGSRLISLAQEGERHYREVFDLGRDPQDGSSRRLRSACCCAIHGTTQQLAGRMAVLQMGTFGILEIGERLLARAPVAGMLDHELLPIGLAVQLVVASAGALLLRWLARAAEALGTRLRHKPLPAPPRRLSPYRLLDLFVCSPLCDSSRGRAPPSASAPAS